MNTTPAHSSDHEGGDMERLTRIGTAATALFSWFRGPMKHLATVALILSLGVVAAHAQDESVKMTFSGTAANSVINLQQPDSSMDEDNFAGNGTLGAFTVRNVRSLPNSPTPSSTCSGTTLLHFTETVGGGVLRIQDGSLLYLKVAQGSDCIDLSTGEAHCVLTFQIIGGTGRFTNAAGTLTMIETALPVLADAFNNPVFFAATGKFKGTISGVVTADTQDRQQQ